MLLDSSSGQFGDELMFVSPQWNFTSPTEMSFYYHLNLDSDDHEAALKVYTYSQLQVFDQHLFTAAGDKGGSWIYAIVCLPVGVYSVAFVGNLGDTYLSDIGLDTVKLESTKVLPCKTSSSASRIASGKLYGYFIGPSTH